MDFENLSVLPERSRDTGNYLGFLPSFNNHNDPRNDTKLHII